MTYPKMMQSGKNAEEKSRQKSANPGCIWILATQTMGAQALIYVELLISEY